MKNLGKINLATFFILFLWAFLAAADPPIERNFLKLPDGRWIWLEKTDWEKTTIRLGKGKKREQNAIWSKDYVSDDIYTWAYAYFVRLKRGKLAYDLNGDGKLEVGVAPYDLGLLMSRDILLFTVEKDHLRFLREHGPINLAADESVF